MTNVPAHDPDGSPDADAIGTDDSEATEATDTVVVDTLGREARAPRRRTRVVGGVVAAVLVLTGAGVATAVWRADRADKADLAAARAAAGADIDALSRAVTAAEDRFAEHVATLDLALAHLESTAVPVRDRLTGVVDEVGQEHVDRVGAALDDVTAALEPPSAPDGGVIGRDGDGAVQALAVALDHLAEADDALEALTAHYRTFPADERAPARAEVAAEAERLDAVARALDQATATVRTAVDDVEVAVAAAAEALRTAGSEALGTLEHADEESRAALQAALDELEALAATDLPMPWESRSVEQASAFVAADAALDAYTATAEAARASHVANTPPPPRARSGGGSGSGGGTRVCYRYSAWGGAQLVLC